MTRILDPLAATPQHPALPWFEYLAIHLEETLAGDVLGDGYLSRAAIDYVAMLQREGRRPAVVTGFFVFGDLDVHARMEELVENDDEGTFDHAFDGMIARFKAECFRLMCEVVPAMTAADADDFTTMSNTYVDVARRLPASAGVYYAVEWDGRQGPFATVMKPTFMNRFNHGLRLKDYPDEDFVLDAARSHRETLAMLVEDGRVELIDEAADLFDERPEMTMRA